MNFSVGMNCFVIFVVYSFVSCEANEWLCPVETTNKTVHEYICRTTNNEIENCHLTTDIEVLNLPPNDSKVIELKLKECSFEAVNLCIKFYENVTSLDISDSGYYTLDSLYLNHKFLKTFNSSYNQISQIPRNFFVNLPEITEVDFSHNYISKIDSETFGSANKLITIHISHNKLSAVSKGIFANLKDLEYVDLSHNSIFRLRRHHEVFSDNKKMKVLHLESNQDISNALITPVVASVYTTFKNLRAQHIYRLDNKLPIVANSSDEGYFQTSNNYTEIHCNEHSFENLQRLTIDRNEIENIHDLFECFGPSPSLEQLSLSGCPIRNMNLTTFLRFAKINDFALHGIESDSFDIAILQHLPNISSLDLSINDFKTLENLQLLKTFRILRRFSIADNDLKNIPEIIDTLSPSIEHLVLSGNLVGDISQINFGKFENLVQLSLKNTSLQLGDVDPFEQNQKLKWLEISNNNLAKWNFSLMAKTLNQLERFFAAECQIEDPIEVIQLLGRDLRFVDLSNNNHLQELRTSTLKSSGISRADLVNMNMTRIVFEENFRGIYHLNISSNQLTELNFTIIMDSLRTIDIASNNLAELINFDRLHLPNLGEFNTENNNFSCEYIADLLERIKIEWPKLKLNGDPYKQKHGQDCHPNVPK